MTAKKEGAFKVVAENRKARFRFEILDTLECGIALVGSRPPGLQGLGKITPFIRRHPIVKARRERGSD